MKFLFAHQNFPGQFLHLLRHLEVEGGHEIIFLTQANDNLLTGVRKLVYQTSETPAETHPDVQEFEAATRRATAAAGAATALKRLGFVPDVIIGHHGWGELLNLPDVFPDVPLLGYFEFFYHARGLDVNFDPEFPMPETILARLRIKNAINLLALANPGHGQTPTRFQLDTYPDWARRKIALLPEGVNLDQCRPDPGLRRRRFEIPGLSIAPRRKLLTYVARDLEPYRGFHIFMRALPRLLEARPDLEVALVGGDGVSYGAKLPQGSWKDRMLQEVGRHLDPARVHFVGRVPYEHHLKLLQRSDAHVYLTYPFVASWSLREALASGCAVVGSDTAPVREFIEDGRNGLLTPCLDPQRLAARVLEVLEDQALAARLRAGARAEAEKALRMEDHIAGYQALIRDMAEGRIGR